MDHNVCTISEHTRAQQFTDTAFLLLILDHAFFHLTIASICYLNISTSPPLTLSRSGLEAFDDASRREELKYGRPPREVRVSLKPMVAEADVQTLPM